MGKVKFYKLESLPEFDEKYQGIYINVENLDESRFYLGTTVGWKELTNNFRFSSNGSIAQDSNGSLDEMDNIATGINSFAIGKNAKALGDYSFASGSGSITNNLDEHAEGKYNKSTKTTNTFGDKGNTLHSIGIGTSDWDRANAVEVMQNGDIYIKGVGGYNGNNFDTSDTLQKILNDFGQIIIDDELVISASLNDINNRIIDYKKVIEESLNDINIKIKILSYKVDYLLSIIDDNDSDSDYFGDYIFKIYDDDITPGDYIDLGLPSGTRWASCNLGATKPEEYGDYYAWGETSPKEIYDWSTYKYGSYSYDLTKYNTNSSYGTVDNKTVLEPEDDAVYVATNGDAHMPTKEQINELINNTLNYWSELNGVFGRIFIGSNGNSIFIPAAGVKTGFGLELMGSRFNVWSASLYEVADECYNSRVLLGFTSYNPYDYFTRCYGCSVRGCKD